MRSAPGFNAEWLVRCLAGGPAIGYWLDGLRAFTQLFVDFAQKCTRKWIVHCTTSSADLIGVRWAGLGYLGALVLAGLSS